MEMDRKESLRIIFETINQDDLVISTTGLISREIYEKYDSERVFYMPGSMGLAGSIGLGLALSLQKVLKDKMVYVIDGDAACLMNLGTLVTEGVEQPANYAHIIIDNGAYGSCSEEQSASSKVSITQIAKATGFTSAFEIWSSEDLKNAIIASRCIAGPMLLDVKISLGGRRDFKRPLDMPYIAERFKKFVEREEK